jgi:hypothetical protein
MNQVMDKIEEQVADLAIATGIDLTNKHLAKLMRDVLLTAYEHGFEDARKKYER